MVQNSDPTALAAWRTGSIRSEDACVFAKVHAAAKVAPLTEFTPEAPGDEAASLGFAMAWAADAAKGGLVTLALPDAALAETGASMAEGLAGLGVDLDRLLLLRTRTQTDALWAAEQTLAVPGALALCIVAPAKKALSLTATRRLLLFAERNATRCLLLRLDRAGASAAWTRWIVRPAPSEGEGRELGRPAFSVTLSRNRAGPAGACFTLDWNADARTFIDRNRALDGAVAHQPSDRSAEAYRRGAA